MRIPLQVQALARFHQEVDDFGELDVEQRRELRSGQHQRIEIYCRSYEIRAEVTGSVPNRVALDKNTLHEVGRRQGRHPIPRTYASMLPAQVILSPPGRSAYRVMSRPTVGPWWPHPHSAKLMLTRSPLITPPHRP